MVFSKRSRAFPASPDLAIAALYPHQAAMETVTRLVRQRSAAMGSRIKHLSPERTATVHHADQQTKSQGDALRVGSPAGVSRASRLCGPPLREETRPAGKDLQVTRGKQVAPTGNNRPTPAGHGHINRFTTITTI
jgi:hypothetical protein